VVEEPLPDPAHAGRTREIRRARTESINQTVDLLASPGDVALRWLDEVSGRLLGV